MANRWMTQFGLTMEKKVVNLYAKITFGSSGAPTLVTSQSKGIVSVTRNTTGTYTFVFGTTSSKLDTYNKLLGVSSVFNTGGTTAPLAPELWIQTDSTATAGTASLKVVTNYNKTATDPASGEIGYFNFVFKDSTAP